MRPVEPRLFALVALFVAACKGSSSDKPKQAPPHGSATVADASVPIAIDWSACDAALQGAAAAPLAARPKLVIDGCRVCGDWTPILRWNAPAAKGGPTRAAIEAAMAGCNAYCSGDAKQKFLGTLDKARGTNARTPWRQLGEICKEQVSAVPDQRFVSAPYFALDRIARAAAARGGQTATLASALELPLPALTLVGTGIPLPELGTGVSPQVGALQITVLARSIHVGRLPRAKLGANGITVELGADGYPGKAVSIAELGDALGKLGGGDKAQAITLVAPTAMPAQSLVPIIAAAAPVAPIHLAARAHESPEGWELPGAIPVALEAGGEDAIAVGAGMTVGQLATELAERAAGKVDRIGVTAP